MSERRENITELRRQVAQLEKIKPDANGRYKYANRVFTKTAWEEYVGEFKNRLSRLEGAAQIRGEETGRANQQAINTEISAANKKRAEINEYLTDFVQAFNKARTVEEEDALRVWRDYYQKEVNKLNKYVDDLQAGRVFVGAINLDTPFQKYQPEQVTPRPSSTTQPSTARPATTAPDISTIKNEDQARTEIQNTRARINKLRSLVGERQSNGVVLYFEAPGVQPGMTAMQRDAIIASSEARIAALNSKFFAETPVTSPPATQPFTPGPGQGVFGEPAPTVPVGGNAPVPGVVYGGMGTAGTTAAPTGAAVPAATGGVTAPAGGGVAGGGVAGGGGGVAAPAPTAGPTYTDPATQVTYQPGQQIGGEDRTLPNGGAVVDGIYVPPGINYTWLGQQIPQDWKQAAQELYGAYYDMIKNDPQISKLLEDAIKNSWSPEKFQVELEKTNWWRTTTANARQFQVLETTDPATARAQLDNRMAIVRETAQRLGVTLDSESLERIARNAISLGFELTAQVEDLVGSEAIRTSGGVSQLRFGYLGNSLRESAAKYGVSLSDVTFNEWLNKIAVGAESVETFETYANQIARTLYPTLSSGFDRGLSFGQMTDPYAQVASRLLEIPTSQMDFTDPKWAQAFIAKNDKGEQVPMSYSEWADYVRTNPSFGYEYTDEAVNKAYTVVTQLAELFGKA